MKLPNAFDRNSIVRGSVEVLRSRNTENKTLEWILNNRSIKSSTENTNHPFNTNTNKISNTLLNNNFQPIGMEEFLFINIKLTN